ncbi:PHD-type domain-containing protein, partial [Aphis craccivora]
MSNYLSNHARSLTGDVKRIYLDKIEVLCPRDSYFLIKDSILTKNVYTLEQFKAHKSLDAYNFFVSGWVFNAKWLALNDYVLVVAE